jgi:hypothetical protein
MTSLETALSSLHQQSMDRGLRGRLEDFDIRLCEDGKTVSVWAFYELNPPLMACFELAVAADPSEFSNAALYDEAERFAAVPATFH